MAKALEPECHVAERYHAGHGTAADYADLAGELWQIDAGSGSGDFDSRRRVPEPTSWAIGPGVGHCVYTSTAADGFADKFSRSRSLLPSLMLARAQTWWTILRICIEERLVYRGDFWLGTLMRFLPIVTQIFLWGAVFEGMRATGAGRRTASPATATTISSRTTC